MPTPSLNGAGWPQFTVCLLTERRDPLRASTSNRSLEGEWSRAWLFKDYPPPGSLMPLRAALREQEEKESKQKTLSSPSPQPHFFNTFQFMRFDKEIKALPQAVPISQCKYSLKIATSRKAFISMSFLKENWEDMGQGVGKILLKRSHTCTQSPLPLHLKNSSFYSLCITHQKCHEKPSE